MDKLTRDLFLKMVFNYEGKKEWEYQGNVPCLIDFQDESCPPCQAIAPVMRELAEIYDGRVKFYNVDVREEERLSQELGVRNLPTLVLCPLDDKPVVIQGAATKEKIITAVENVLLGGISEKTKE